MRIKMKVAGTLAATAAICCFAQIGTASAASITLPMSVTAESLATGVAGGASVGGGTSFSQLPATGIFGNGFSCSSCASSVLLSDGGNNYNYYDDYVFTVAASTIDAVSSTIDLGQSLSLDNLQMRLYSAPADNSSLNIPVLTGTPPGLLSGSAATGGWSTPLDFNAGGSSGQISVLNNIMLGTGTYVLEIRGDVTGASGGSYSGTLNLTPVPLPA
ncbi:MAG TPA: hypothetical protein VHB68_08040, partial [Steroidobacteraceae bacterium]|nr:hypothetical protein [Steroidobacteraceae bacterium]